MWHHFSLFALSRRGKHLSALTISLSSCVWDCKCSIIFSLSLFLSPPPFLKSSSSLLANYQLLWLLSVECGACVWGTAVVAGRFFLRLTSRDRCIYWCWFWVVPVVVVGECECDWHRFADSVFCCVYSFFSFFLAWFHQSVSHFRQ